MECVADLALGDTARPLSDGGECCGEEGVGDPSDGLGEVLVRVEEGEEPLLKYRGGDLERRILFLPKLLEGEAVLRCSGGDRGGEWEGELEGDEVGDQGGRGDTSGCEVLLGTPALIFYKCE